MAESVTLFTAVAGVLVLRSRVHVNQSTRVHRTCIINPISYCVIIAAVFVRSAVRHPVEGVAIFVFNLVGTGVYKLRVLHAPASIEDRLE